MTAGMTELLAQQVLDPNPAKWILWAEIGLGDPASEATIVPPPSQTSLYRPLLLLKKPSLVGYLDEEAYALGHVLISTEVDGEGIILPTQYLYLVFHFPSVMMADTQLPGAYMRELAVYVGGTLLTIVNHNRIWFDKTAQLRRELILIIPPYTK
jgi:hypothetical protein